jgi:hypothetical protein
VPKGQPVNFSTVDLAMSGAAKLPAADVAAIIEGVGACATRVKTGAGTEVDWGTLAGHIDLAQAIERGGVVRGMSGHLATIRTRVYAIRDRAKATTTWAAPEVTTDEAEAIDLLLDLHKFQIEALSRSELRTALKRAVGVNTSGGNTVEMRRDTGTTQ